MNLYHQEPKSCTLPIKLETLRKDISEITNNFSRPKNTYFINVSKNLIITKALKDILLSESFGTKVYKKLILFTYKQINFTNEKLVLIF